MKMTQKFTGAALPLALLALTAPLSAQVGSGYQGPGVLSRGAQGVGNRSGQQVDLRYSIGIDGVYDTGLVPLSLGSNGQLATISGVAGVQGSLSANGSHSWRRALVGINYGGFYRYYPSSSYYSGSNQNLTLGYTFQKSRRLSFDLQLGGGTMQFGNAGFQNAAISSEGLDPNSALLFDNRVTFGGGGLHVNYNKSARTLFTFGGSAFTARRQNRQLAGTNGYTLDGSIQRVVTRVTTFGVSYNRTHFDYSKQFGETDLDTAMAYYAHGIGRSWKVELQAGVYLVETQGLQQVALDPQIAALLGVSSGVRTFYRKITSPLGRAAISWTGRSSTFNIDYGRSTTPGNGLYLTSTSDNGSIGYSYTGFRNWTFSSTANTNRMRSVAQSLNSYRSSSGTLGFTRRLTDSLHLTAQASLRRQQVIGINRWSQNYTVGFAYSPGSLPLSLW